MKIVVLYLLTAAAVQVYARSNGAPLQACDTITPLGHTNPSNTASSSNPFSLYLNAFACPTGTVGYCYYPGATYQCKCVLIEKFNTRRHPAVKYLCFGLAETTWRDLVKSILLHEATSGLVELRAA